MSVPVAYYNENDPYMADWLRELIKADMIALGVVDERDIQDIRPDELMGYTQHHFFAGLGGWSYALRLAGWPNDRPVWTGSCPCQPFSAAGKRGGFADERHLWPAWFHLISQCKPIYVFGEQVASKDGLAWLDTVQTDMEATGYTFWPVDLCAAGFGAPHIRQRLWFVAESDRNGHGEDGGWGAKENSIPGIGGTALCGREFGGTGGVADRMANTEGTKQQRGKPEARRIIRCGAVGKLAFPDGEQEHSTTERGLHAESGECGDMGDTNEARLQRWSLQSGQQSNQLASRKGMPVNGFWRDAIWLPCRDGKARPVEPVLIKMASRVSSDLGYLCHIDSTSEKEEKVNADNSKARPDEVLRKLREDYHAETVRGRPVGGHDSIQEKDVLQQKLYGLGTGENGLSECESQQDEGTQDDAGNVRGVREGGKTSCPPHGRESKQQHPREFENFVRLLPSAYSFAKLHGDVYTEKAVQILFKGCGEDWFMQHTSNSFEEIWSSVSEEVQNRLAMDFADNEWVIAPEFPLVNGTTNRGGRLRGYGNAIVSEVAAEFIRAYMEASSCTAR